MLVSFTQESSADVAAKLNEAVALLKHQARTFFDDRAYGAGVESMIVGLICAEDSLLMSGAIRPRKVRFQKATTPVPNREGKQVSYKNLVTWDIVLDHLVVRTCSSTGSLVAHILEQFSESLEGLARIKKFDLAAFSNDVADFHREMIRGVSLD